MPSCAALLTALVSSRSNRDRLTIGRSLTSCPTRPALRNRQPGLTTHSAIHQNYLAGNECGALRKQKLQQPDRIGGFP